MDSTHYKIKKRKTILKRVLTVSEVATGLAISKQTVLNYIKAGKINAVKITTNNRTTYRIQRLELERILNSGSN